MSPFLFSIFLNDLEDYLKAKQASGINCEVNADDAYIYFQLLILLYADDTAIFSETKDNLQTALKGFEDYCTKWKLNVNISKTKVVIFSRGRPNKNNSFTFQNKQIEVVDEYK